MGGGLNYLVSHLFGRVHQFEVNELSFAMQTTAPSEYVTGSKQSITLLKIDFDLCRSFLVLIFIIV